MIKPRVYLDTTVPSALLDARAPERQELTREFWQRAPSQYELVVSTLVLDEIRKTPGAERRKELEALAATCELVELPDSAYELADLYIGNGVIVAQYGDDALHNATAAVHSLTILASWNFRHMVRLKTRQLVNLVNAANGYGSLDIVTPGQL
ncbi:MAG: PIN domain-containing protein [Fimbriimonadales bacterium]